MELRAMEFSGPILAVGRVRRGATPLTGADPRCLIVEVRTPTTMGQFVELELAENAASDLAAKLADCLDFGKQNWQSLESELDEQAARENE
jgi:hypothetical protein